MTFYKKYDYQDQKQGPRYDSYYKPSFLIGVILSSTISRLAESAVGIIANISNHTNIIL